MLISKKSLTLHFCTILLMSFASTDTLQAKTAEQWTAAAGRVINSFETKKLNQATPDFDCQGISFGRQQKPIRNRGLRQLVLELNLQDPADAFDIARELARKHMPNSKAVFLKILDLVENGKESEARRESLKLQILENSSECEGGKTSKQFKPGVQKEIEDWLSSDKITAAQLYLKKKDSRNALKAAYCWNAKYAESKTLTFAEFLFHFDFLTNAGGLGIYGGEFYKITNLLRDHNQYGFEKQKRIRRKSEFLVDWMKEGWRNQISETHVSDARRNASLLDSEGIKLGYDELQLLFVRMIRSTVGSTPAQMNFFNRGFVLLLAEGWFQGSKRDFRPLYEKMGVIDVAETANINCD